jgi:hypothetical protein
MTESLPATLFGVPRGLDAEELAELEDFLRAAWQAQYGKSPSTLTADLDRMRDVFKAGASAKRIRELVSDLRKLPRRPSNIAGDVFVAVDDHRGLVTPEGRVLLEELVHMRTAAEQVLTRDALLRAYALVADVYGRWQREWLSRQLGTTSLRPGTYGVVLFLLLNGSTSRETALRLPADDEQERALARTVLPVIGAFASRLGGKEISERESARLRSNWRVTEARRHLFQRVKAADEDGDAFMWIDDEEATLKLLADRLAARRDLDLDTLHDALQAAAESYTTARPTLASWAVAHDRINHTQHVLSRLESLFVDERTAT